MKFKRWYLAPTEDVITFLSDGKATKERIKVFLTLLPRAVALPENIAKEKITLLFKL